MSNMIGIKRENLTPSFKIKDAPLKPGEHEVVEVLDPHAEEERAPPIVRTDIRDAIYQSWEDKRAAEQSPHRKKLGASDIGAECGRAVWYTWRHAMRRNLPGKLLRLFDRGSREEEVIEADFKRIGWPISTIGAGGGQHRFGDETGHFAVNLDGIVEDPADGRKFVIEMKTMSRWSFAKLEKMGGVRYSHPHYYAQIMAQIKTAEDSVKVDAGLFVAVCKDTDEIWTEEVPINKEVQDRVMRRARGLIGGAMPPAPLDSAPSAPPCKWCDWKPICRDHRYELVEKSCRTCEHAQAVMGGRWKCNAGEPFGTACSKWAMHKGF